MLPDKMEERKMLFTYKGVPQHTNNAQMWILLPD